ncbi:hypothetical protein NDU88_002429 [Pleurodeles waltl]|uniref:Uncharacterized protein n=1 Tax=Pleurodeles waltl TaxID=8319 RepID=A0AAV7W252_PLEWA|nr:hypothetical protein NDU88_002429 [Pleurodeles waltl]
MNHGPGSPGEEGSEGGRRAGEKRCGKGKSGGGEEAGGWGRASREAQEGGTCSSAAGGRGRGPHGEAESMGPVRGPIGAGRWASEERPGGRQQSVRRVPPAGFLTEEGLRGPKGLEVGDGEGASEVARDWEEERGSPQVLRLGDQESGEWQQDMGDPRVSISKKWPTMLQWSSSEDEVEQERVWGAGEDQQHKEMALNVPPGFMGTRWILKRRSQVSSLWLSHPGTKRRRGLGRPAGWRHQDGVDDSVWLRTFPRDGVGVAPTDAAVLGEQRPGPSGIRGRSGVMSVGCEFCGGCGRDRGHVGSERRAEDSDTSLEEGELVKSRSESDWWERGRGTGVANPVLQSFQAETWSSVRPRDIGSGVQVREVPKAQERPPLLSPGRDSVSSMVSVATEAREDSVRLVKGVYVQDMGVATDSGVANNGDGAGKGGGEKVVAPGDGKGNAPAGMAKEEKDGEPAPKRVRLPYMGPTKPFGAHLMQSTKDKIWKGDYVL